MSEHPDDGYDDDRPGMMRVHVFVARQARMVRMFTLEGLRQHAHERGLSTRGNKPDVSERLIEAGYTATDLIHGERESRHTRGRSTA